MIRKYSLIALKTLLIDQFILTEEINSFIEQKNKIFIHCFKSFINYSQKEF